MYLQLFYGVELITAPNCFYDEKRGVFADTVRRKEVVDLCHTEEMGEDIHWACTTYHVPEIETHHQPVIEPMKMSPVLT